MNSVYYYFSYLWYGNQPTETDMANVSIVPKKFIISPSDLKKVDLVHHEGVTPSPSRNMPLLDTFELNIYNKAQLTEILNIKLKPTKINEKPTYYPPRHPVVKQLNERFGIGNNMC
jgi:hypothetical protein